MRRLAAILALVAFCAAGADVSPSAASPAVLTREMAALSRATKPASTSRRALPPCRANAAVE